MPCSKQTVCGPIDASLAFYLDSKYILKPVNDGMCEWGPDREGTLRFFREGLYCSLTWTRYRKTGKCDFLRYVSDSTNETAPREYIPRLVTITMFQRPHTVECV